MKLTRVAAYGAWLALVCQAAWSYEPSINYALHCMGCHTPDGSGTPGRVPAVRDTLLPLARSPAGRQYLLQVPGSSQSPLSNSELAAVLNWMIESFTGAKDFNRFTEAEVARYRTHTLTNVGVTRARLLEALR